MLNKSYQNHKETIYNLFWRSLQIFGKQGITFLIFIICAKLLTPYEFGIYNYILAITLILAIFSDFGISTATSKYVAEYNVTDKEKLKSVLFNSGIIIISLTAVIILVVLFFGEAYFGDNYLYVLYLLPLVFLAPIASLYDGIYRGLNKFKFVAIISLIVGLVSLSFIYNLIKQYGLIGALISQNIFYFLLFVALAFGYKEFNLKINKDVIREIGKYSLVIGIGSIGWIVYSRIDILFLGYYGFIEEIGYYEIINKFLIVFLTPFLIIGQVISPNITQHFIKRNYDVVNIKFKKYLFVSFLLSVLVVVFFFLTNRYFMSNFLNEYDVPEMHLILDLMLIVYFTQMLNGIIPLGFVNATGHAKLSTYVLVFFGIIHVVLNYIFINWFGFVGIIYSIVLTRCTADLVFIYAYHKILSNLK